MVVSIKAVSYCKQRGYGGSLLPAGHAKKKIFYLISGRSPINFANIDGTDWFRCAYAWRLLDESKRWTERRSRGVRLVSGAERKVR